MTMFILHACFYIGLLSGIASGSSLKDYAFEFPSKNANDFIQIWGMPRLTQFTICFWMKSSDEGDGTPFSYAAQGAENELLITKYNNFSVWIGNEKRELSVSGNDGTWHHICVSWENGAGSLKFYKDGVLSANEENFKIGHMIPPGGSVVLGQQAGGLNDAKAFQGFLSNLNVWDYVLCQEIVTRMSKVCSLGEGNVYKWSVFLLGILGDSRLFIPSPCSPPTADIDHCASNPCMNNGTCVDLGNRYSCSCLAGFTGTGCETDVDECQSNPCLNNGTCSDQVSGYTCSCPPGFAGDRCEAGFLRNSTIVKDNAFYQLHLHQFLTPAVGDNPQWLLCYRASLHGWQGPTFHSNCDGKSHTVTIIKNGEYIFGGYTDIPWDSITGYGATSNAFIISLKNKEGREPFKSAVRRTGVAIYKLNDFGPTFGQGHDIKIANNANSNTQSHSDFGNSYTVPSGVGNRRTILAGTESFSPDELEVFYLG